MERLSLKSLEQMLINASEEEFEAIRCTYGSDDRKAVISLFDKYKRKLEKAAKERQEYQKRNLYENALYEKGYTFIAGIDEVGRGPLAGPVYAGAVILKKNSGLLGVKDSKKLSEKQRELLYDLIKENSIAYAVGSATNYEIDEINILNATKLAMKRAIEKLKVKPEYLLIDALTLEDVNLPQKGIIKGDDLSISIGAASILAKVERDRYMKEIAGLYPQYNFESNKGYGSGEHIEAIKKFGKTDIHRNTFIRNFL